MSGANIFPSAKLTFLAKIPGTSDANNYNPYFFFSNWTRALDHGTKIITGIVSYLNFLRITPLNFGYFKNSSGSIPAWFKGTVANYPHSYLKTPPAECYNIVN